MGQGDVVLTILSKTANAVRNMGAWTKSQTKAERATARGNRTAQRQARIINKSTAALGKYAAGFVTFAGATRGGQASLKGVREETERLVAFEDELTALLSLGDDVDFGKIKQETRDLSTAIRIPTQQIADFFFDLKSGSAALSDEMRTGIKQEAIEMKRVMGGELATSMKVLLKVFNIYGDQIESVDLAQSKLIKTGERGFLQMDELSRLLPEVANAAKAMDISIDELLGTIVRATQVGGRTERTLTGVRNVFLRMPNAVKEGVELTDDFITNIEIISKLDVNLQKKIFGDEAISAIAGLTDNTAALRTEIALMAQVTEGVGDRKLFERLADEGFALAESLGRIKQARENIKAAGPVAGKAQTLTEEFELSRLGAEAQLPSFARFLAPVAAIDRMIRARTTIGGRENEFLQAGAQIVAGAQERAGLTGEADLFRKRVSGLTGGQPFAKARTPFSTPGEISDALIQMSLEHQRRTFGTAEAAHASLDIRAAQDPNLFRSPVPPPQTIQSEPGLQTQAIEARQGTELQFRIATEMPPILREVAEVGRQLVVALGKVRDARISMPATGNPNALVDAQDR